MPEDIKLPPGYTLDPDANIKLPPGYTLDASAPAQDQLDDPNQRYLYTTKEGIPVYAASSRTDIPEFQKVPLQNAQGEITQPKEIAPLSTGEKILLSPLKYLSGGFQQFGQGLEGLTHPKSAEQMAGSASDVIRGGMTTATPFMLPEIVAKPLASLAGLGTYGAAGGTAEWLAQKVMPEGYARLFGDLAGIYGGQKAYRWLARMAQEPDRMLADQLYRQMDAAMERLRDPALTPGDRAATKAQADALLGSIREAEGIQLGPLFPNMLNPVERQSIDRLRDAGVRMKPGTLTGNRYLRAVEGIVEASPLGSVRAREFNRGTEEDLHAVGRDLMEQARPGEVLTPESAGTGTKKELQRKIEEELTPERNAAYKDAWVGRDNKRYTREVKVGVAADGSYITDDVNMPVDLRDIQDLAQPIYDELDLKLSQADKARSTAFNALKWLLTDARWHEPAWKLEHALGALKEIARTKTESGVRDIGQGTAAYLIPELQKRIDAAVAQTGESAIRGLQKGRATHASIMEVKEVADDLLHEPVQAFGKMTWAQDAGIDYLRQIAKHAPDSLTKIGRAWIYKQFELATREGGITRTKQTLNNWRDLGPETKKLLFPDPEMRANLDAFFKGLDLVTFNTNTSGTEITRQATSLNPFRWAAGYAGGKVLYSARGIKLLTEGLSIPRDSRRARAIEAELKRLGAQNPPESGPPAGGGSGPGPIPAGGGGIVTRLNDKIQGNAAARAQAGIATPGGSPDEPPATPDIPTLKREASQIDTGGNKVGTKAAGEYVAQQKITWLEEQAKAARERLQPLISGTKLGADAFADPAVIRDMAILTIHSGYRGAMKAAEFTKLVIDHLGDKVSDLGDSLKQFVGKVQQQANQLLGDYSQHIPPPAGERQSPLKAVTPVEVRNKRGELVGSLNELRRASEREPGIGGPDNERTVLRDSKGVFAVGKITPVDWLNRVKAHLGPRELKEARRWYGELEGFFAKHFGEENGPRMLLAWLSSQQNASPSAGMMNVLRVVDQIRGLPKYGYKAAGLAEEKIKAALLDQMPEGGYGAKLTDFVDSGLGKNTRTWMGDDVRGGQPAVIDVWANRDAGKIDNKLYEYLKDRFGEDAVKNLKIDGNGIGETDYEYGSQFYNSIVQQLNKQRFDGGKWTGAEVQAVGWVAMQKAMGAVPEYPSDLITKNSRSYGYEIAPGEGSPLARQYPWQQLSPEQQQNITSYIGERVTDLAARLTGAKITSRHITVGGYMGQPSASIQMNGFGSPETLQDFAAALGHLGQQTEVWSIRPLKSGNAWAYFVRPQEGGKGFSSPEQMQEFWQKVSARTGTDLVPGYSAIRTQSGENGVMLVNPFSREYAFARQKAGLSTDASLRPWSAKQTIEQAMKDVTEEMGLDMDLHFDRLELGVSAQNWSSDGKAAKKGLTHLSGAIERGRSNLRDELRGDASQRSVSQWWQEAWEKFAPDVPTGKPASRK